MKTATSLLFVSFMAVSTSAAARAPVPIVDYPAVEAKNFGGTPLTASQVSQAIQDAARKRGWIILKQKDGKLIARRGWKDDKHVIYSEITPIEGGYSLVYKSSVNMNYSADGGWANDESGGNAKLPVIHPYYNRYVSKL
ncbi:MAG: hypothetical protein LBJ76_02085, partial [Candidatus Accumulibacter sp.]|nr:hypothetical protein [Accumulibacter sp.]